MPTAVRIGIGVLLWVAYLSYLVSQGRAAAAKGVTGLLTEAPRSWRTPARCHDDLVVPGRLTDGPALPGPPPRPTNVPDRDPRSVAPGRRLPDARRSTTRAPAPALAEPDQEMA
jgi:hypothetical protein